jgi:hypothetical protein
MRQVMLSRAEKKELAVMLIDQLWQAGVTFDALAETFQVPVKQVAEWAYGKRAPNKAQMARLEEMAKGAPRPSPAVQLTLAAMLAREKKRLANKARVRARYGDARPPRWGRRQEGAPSAEIKTSIDALMPKRSHQSTHSFKSALPSSLSQLGARGVLRAPRSASPTSFNSGFAPFMFHTSGEGPIQAIPKSGKSRAWAAARSRCGIEKFTNRPSSCVH